LGLQVVGWYHSHPRFCPNPSLIDVYNQCQYQRLLDNERFLGLIISSFDSKNESMLANHQWFHTCMYQDLDSPSTSLPMRVEVDHWTLCGTVYEDHNDATLFAQALSQVTMDWEVGISYSSIDQVLNAELRQLSVVIAEQEEVRKQERQQQVAYEQEVCQQEARKQEALNEELRKQEVCEEEAREQESRKEEALKEELREQEAREREAHEQKALEQEALKTMVLVPVSMGVDIGDQWPRRTSRAIKAREIYDDSKYVKKKRCRATPSIATCPPETGNVPVNTCGISSASSLRVSSSTTASSIDVTDDIYNSFLLSIKDPSILSSNLAREIVIHTPIYLRYLALIMISLGLHYCRSQRRVDLDRSWKSCNTKLLKMECSALRWVALFQTNDGSSTDPKTTAFLTDFLAFLGQAWQDYSKTTGKLKIRPKKANKNLVDSTPSI
jgi:hypothetical protein